MVMLPCSQGFRRKPPQGSWSCCCSGLVPPRCGGWLAWGTLSTNMYLLNRKKQMSRKWWRLWFHSSWEITSESLCCFSNCLLEKCFDSSLYEFFDVGMSWSRVQEGAVEQCVCVNGQIECEGVEHRSKAPFCIKACWEWGWRTVRISKPERCYTL